MDRSSLTGRSVLFLIALMLVFSYPAFSGGIRWYHRLNFNGPSNVNATVTKQTYTGASPSGNIGQAILKAQYSSVIDNLPAVIIGGRSLTTNVVSGLSLSLVKTMGPALIISLGLLVWDEVLKMWVKPGRVPDVNSSGYPVCDITKPLNVIRYNGTNSCVRTCSYVHKCPGAFELQPPWRFVTYRYDPNGPCQCSMGPWSIEWQSSEDVIAFPPIPATDAEILSALNNHLNSSTNALSDFVNTLVNKTDLGPALSNASTTHSLTGPNAVTSTNTSTSTGPDGQTQTTTQTNYHLTYNEATSTVNITQTIDKTVTGPDGQTQTTTETNTGNIDPTINDPPPDYTDNNDPEKPPLAQSDMCKDHPDILACILLGTLEDQTIPEKPGPSNISKEMSAVGSCPADIDLTILGHQFSISWIYVCQFAERIRPILLALTWVLAGIFVIRSMSSE